MRWWRPGTTWRSTWPSGPRCPDGRPDTARSADPMARQAEAIALDRIILPYDRVFGQYKSHNSLLGLGSAAHDEFQALAAGPGGPDPARSATPPSASSTDGSRARPAAVASSPSTARTTPGSIWLPMQLALRPDQHDQQAEIDDVIERLVEQDFTDDNAAIY